MSKLSRSPSTGQPPLPAPIVALPAWWGPVIDEAQRRGLDAGDFDLGDLGLEHGHEEHVLPEFAQHEQPMRRYLVCQRLTLHELACVFVAIDMLTARSVVLKISRREVDPEARNIIELRHANVVTVLDVFVHEGYPTFVLEWCSQGTLDDYARCANNWREVFARVVEGGRGLLYCHARGLVHGDVKLGNFLVADDVGKLADLGIARPPTHEGPVLGTIFYAPPERAKGVWSFAGDVFSFGVVIERALAGFEVAKHVAPVVAAATRTEPEQRPSLADVLDELAAIRAALDGDGDALERRRAWQAIEQEKAEIAGSQRRVELALLEASKPKPRARWQVVGGVLAMLVLVVGSVGLGAMLDTRSAELDPVSTTLRLAREAHEQGDARSTVQFLELASRRAKTEYDVAGLRRVALEAESIGHEILATGDDDAAKDCWLVAFECYAALNDTKGKLHITKLMNPRR